MLDLTQWVKTEISFLSILNTAFNIPPSANHRIALPYPIPIPIPDEPGFSCNSSGEAVR